MTTMSMTAAIREASTYCAISGRGTSWQVYGPHSVANLRGPSTSTDTDSYAKAVRIRALWRAEIAFALMGRANDDTHYSAELHMQNPYASHALRDIVRAALKA